MFYPPKDSSAYAGWAPNSAQPTQPAPPSGESAHVDDEAVPDVGGEDTLVRLVDALGRDHLDVAGDAVLRAEVEHLLRLADAPDAGPGEGRAVAEQGEHVDRQRLRGCADVDHGAVKCEQLQVRVKVDDCAHRVDDEVEAVRQIRERRRVARRVVVVGPQPKSVLLLAQRLRQPVSYTHL